MSALCRARRTSGALLFLLVVLVAAQSSALALTSGAGVPSLARPDLRPFDGQTTSAPALVNRDGWAAAAAVPGELLVTTSTVVDSTAGVAISGLASRALGVVENRSIGDRVSLIRTAPGMESVAATALGHRPDVAAVEPNLRRQFMAQPDDTSYGLQWAHQRTNVEDAWDVTTGGSSIGETRPLVAILDSGADATHPDLADVIVETLQTVDGEVLEGPRNNDPCAIGHGTAVGGITGARGNNALGISGVLWNPRILDVSLTNPGNGCPGGPSDADAITAISHMTGRQEKPLVMNLSFGGSADECTVAYQAAIDAARAAGIVIVSSAGNTGRNSAMIPASCNGVMSIAATDRNDLRANYSQINPYIDMTAPGGLAQTCPSTLAEIAAEAILTTSLTEPKFYSFGPACRPTIADPNGHRLEATTGTSFSTPYLVGAVALLRQRAIDTGSPLSPDDVEALIEGTARDIGPVGRDDDNGWGLLDLGAAMARLEAGDVPPLQPDPVFPVAGQDSIDALRVADRTDLSRTDPVRQAVAVSQVISRGAAAYAVLARVDDFADALSGSAVGFGIGPLLYTSSIGRLDPRTRDELLRVLDFGQERPPVVFVMGGTAAIPSTVDGDLEAIGVRVQRIAGQGREQTAIQASLVVEQLKVAAAGTIVRDHVFVTSGRAFPDAVAAGQMAAHYGIPILVTNPDGLNDDTAAEITRLNPERVWVLGGTSALSTDVFTAVEALGFPTARLAGETRIGTALAVFDLYTRELALDGDGALEDAVTLAVNLRHSYHDVLSATFLAGQGNWFFPLEGDDGALITPAARSTFCAFGGELRVIGGRDRVVDATVAELSAILDGSGC